MRWNSRHQTMRGHWFACLFMVFAILMSTEVMAKGGSSSKLLNTYEIQIDKTENFVTSQAGSYQTGILTSHKGKILIVAQDHVPQSISSVKVRAQEDGVPSKNVKIMKWKDRSLFYYESDDQIHVYSTRGGHLLISKKSPIKFDLKKLTLVKQAGKKVARL